MLKFLENRTKEKILKELRTYVIEYNNLHLSNRENNEKIRRKLNKVRDI